MEQPSRLQRRQRVLHGELAIQDQRLDWPQVYNTRNSCCPTAITYLEETQNVSVLANQLYMMKVNNSIEFMPVSEGQAPLTEAQFKEAFFACHPYQWQQSFREHNEPSEVDIGRIASFMRLKAQDAAKRERDNQLKQKSNGKRHSPEEWKKRIAHIAQTSNPNDACTLKKSHKNHTVGKCKIINAYKKANKNSIESNAIQCLTVDKVDTDSTTSKESEGMFYLNNATYLSETFSHHIDACPIGSLSNTVASNILDDLTSSYMVNTKAAYENGTEVPETIS